MISFSFFAADFICDIELSSSNFLKSSYNIMETAWLIFNVGYFSEAGIVTRISHRLISSFLRPVLYLPIKIPIFDFL